MGTSIALAHDYLTQRGGAERVVLSLSDVFPEASIHTSFYSPDDTYPEFLERDVRASPLNRIEPVRARHRLALPLYPFIFEGTRIDADLAICSSSGWAHGARVTGRKVVYCHAPARWLYQRAEYLKGFSRGVRPVLKALGPPLRRWDARAASRADLYLANSARTQAMIQAAYGIDAEILPPPHSLDPTGPRAPVPGLEPGYFLTVSRLLSYKHIEQVVESFRSLTDERLVVVGEGPLEHELRTSSPPNVTLLGRVTDAELRWLYSSATALIAMSFEDLGLTPVEAALFGKPTLALRFGGYLDTVLEGSNGEFVETPTVEAIRDGLRSFQPTAFAPDTVKSTAERYDVGHFSGRLRALVDELTT
jgi:glycosyltransferase involved in cell wall biosynthesis